MTIILLFTMVLSTFANAAQVTNRSIALSSSSAGATAVTYEVNFTSVATAGAFVVDFCSNSPVIGQVCDTPAGFNASAAASTSSGFTDVQALNNHTVVVGGTISVSQNISVALSGIANPSNPGALYARIITYDTKARALEYTSEDVKTGTVDSGSVAISITDTIGVGGAVLESMTFCISGAAISANCAGTQPPVLTLGESDGVVTALSPDHVSTGGIHTQLSTNAANGAVISLKSGAFGCGGLKRAGAPAACDILPALRTGISEGQAKFGVKTSLATDTGSDPLGVLQPVAGSGYNTSTFALNYASGDATGITSTYGDPFLDTDGAPANNKNMILIFGVSVSNNTPAGAYSTDLSMVATGTF